VGEKLSRAAAAAATAGAGATTAAAANVQGLALVHFSA